MTGSEYSRKDLENAIDQWVLGRNGERDRILLAMHLFDGVTLEQLQRRMDDMGYPLSVDRIKKILVVRKEQLFRHL